MTKEESKFNSSCINDFQCTFISLYCVLSTKPDSSFLIWSLFFFIIISGSQLEKIKMKYSVHVPGIEFIV